MNRKKFLLFVSALSLLFKFSNYAFAQPSVSPLQNLVIDEPTDTVSLSCIPVRLSTQQVQPVQLHQTFLDDFNAPSLSLQTWRTYYYDDDKNLEGRTLSSNSEREIYVDPDYTGNGTQPLGINPFHTKDGILSITARRTPAELLSKLYNFPYTSGVISTLGSFSQTYGYFEIRARLPSGKALWPAFWLAEHNEWPPEIDILEVMDAEHPDLVSVTTHWHNNGVGEHKMSACNVKVSGSDIAFHLYGVLWTKERIVYYIDRKPVVEMATPPGFDHPMYMLANLAVENGASASTPEIASYDIDWIATYQQ